MSECSVYLISSDAPVPAHQEEGLTTRSSLCKVGISSHVPSRLATLRTASPFVLRLEEVWVCPYRRAAEKLERDIHKSLSAYRASGEWFLSNPSFIGFVASDSYCVEAIDEWGLSPWWVRERLKGMGYDDDYARDCVISNFGAEAFAS
jgi:hypothetical protein